MSKAVWSIYAIALSLGLYSSLLFFLVAFAHGLYVIRTENWRFSKTLIAYLLASEAATIILGARILVGVYNSKRIEETVGCPRLSLSLMSSLKDLIIITADFLSTRIGRAKLSNLVRAICLPI